MGEEIPSNEMGNKDDVYFCFSEASVWKKADVWVREGYFSVDGGEF